MSTCLKLFGGFRLTCTDGALDASPRIGASGRALLAWLALQEGAAPRARCAIALWPDSSRAQALTNLRRELHGLARAGPALAGAVHSTRREIELLVPADWTVDVRRFAVAVRALDDAGDAEARREAAIEVRSIYSGPLLCDDEADWIERHRDAFAADYRRCLVVLAELETRLGHATRAEDCLFELQRFDPFADTAPLLLMQLYIERGESATAREIFRRHAERLRSELGTGPGPALMALHARCDERSAAPIVEASPPPVSRGECGFLARVAERDALCAKLDEASCDRLRFVLIEGEPGIGKSRFASACLERLSLGVPLVSRCVPTAGELPYASLADWLDGPSVVARAEALPSFQRQELIRVFPDRLPPPPQGAAMDRPPVRARAFLFDALDALIAPPETPTVLLLDDIQWCDQDTLDWLSRLADSDRVKNCLVLATRRSQAFGDRPVLDALLARLESLGHLYRHSLDPLDAATALALLDAENAILERPLDAMALPALIEPAEGRPLFLVESLRAAALGRGTRPTRFDALIRERLSASSAPARSLIEHAAVFGREVEIALLERVDGLDDVARLAALDELVARALLEETLPGRFRFTHDCLREAVLCVLGGARRRFLHQRAANALLGVHAGRIGQVSGRVAAHLERAGDAQSSVEWFRRAAASALEGLGPLEAAEFCAHALAQLDREDEAGADAASDTRVSVLLQQAYALSMVHGLACLRITEICTELRRLLPSMAPGRLRTETWRRLRTHASFVGRPAEALDCAREQLRSAETSGELEQCIEAHRSIGWVEYQLGRFARSHASLGRGLALARNGFRDGRLERDSAPWCVLMSMRGRAMTLGLRGRASAATKALDGALGAPSEHLSPFEREFLCFPPVLGMIAIGDESRLRAAAQQARFRADGGGSERVAFLACMAEGAASMLGGAFVEGLERLDAAQRRYATLEEGHMWPLLFGLLAEARVAATEPEQAEIDARRGLATSLASGESYHDAELHRSLARALAAQGKPAPEVESAFDESMRIAARQGAAGYRLRAAWQAAEFARSFGSAMRARAEERLRSALAATAHGGRSRDTERAVAMLVG